MQTWTMGDKVYCCVQNWEMHFSMWAELDWVGKNCTFTNYLKKWERVVEQIMEWIGFISLKHKHFEALVFLFINLSLKKWLRQTILILGLTMFDYAQGNLTFVGQFLCLKQYPSLNDSFVWKQMNHWFLNILCEQLNNLATGPKIEWEFWRPTTQIQSGEPWLVSQWVKLYWHQLNQWGKRWLELESYLWPLN